jgi:hypothetical protein
MNNAPSTTSLLPSRLDVVGNLPDAESADVSWRRGDIDDWISSLEHAATIDFSGGREKGEVRHSNEHRSLAYEMVIMRLACQCRGSLIIARTARCGRIERG